MVLKRMRSTTNAAKERLQALHEQHRELEEHMLAVFSEVLDHTIETPTEEEATLGHHVRHVLKAHGGAEALRERDTQVAAYHRENYRPLMWACFRPYRAAFFQVSRLLTFRSATHDQSLLAALRFVQRFQHARGSTVPTRLRSISPAPGGKRSSAPGGRRRPCCSAGPWKCVSASISIMGCAVAISTLKGQTRTPITASNCCPGRRV